MQIELDRMNLVQERELHMIKRQLLAGYGMIVNDYTGMGKLMDIRFVH